MLCVIIVVLRRVIHSIATEKFDRKKQQQQAGEGKPVELRLRRLVESFTLDGVNWQANDDRKSNRQMNSSAAFFHFRHWDDFCSTG
jgi:hypothetical protein